MAAQLTFRTTRRPPVEATTEMLLLPALCSVHEGLSHPQDRLKIR